MGQFSQSSNGATQLTWLDIFAYCQLNNVELESWEIKTIRSMSLHYVIEMTNSRKSGNAVSPADRIKNPMTGD